MSTRARAVSMTAMWTSVLLSLTWLRAAGRLSPEVTGVILGVAAVGTFVILRFRRARRSEAAVRESCSS